MLSHSLKLRIPLRNFLYVMPVIGFCLAGLNDFYHNAFADYTSAPVITTFGEELRGFIYPTGLIGFIFTVLFRRLTHFLFNGTKVSDVKKGNDGDKAFFHGAALVFLGGLIYMLTYSIYGSPFI